MPINKAQRDGVSKVCENLATAFVAIAIFGYIGFGVTEFSAGVVLACAVILVVAALVIRSYDVSDDD